MKKTFLGFLMAGSVAAFAQTTPTTPTTPTTTPTTTSPTTTSPTTTTPTTTSPTTTTPTTQSSTGIDPMSTNTNTGQLNTNSVNYWTPTASPSWGWNSYGLWNTNAYPNTSVNSTTGASSGTTSSTTDMSATTSTDPSLNNGTMNSNNMAAGTGNLSSSSNYSAYGTSVASLPMNVQNNFSRDYPTSMNNTYSWNQYGDWFYTQYTDKGRSTTYYYDTRGNGYSLALPVIQTYVPEDIIDKALQRYGSNLYSISMVKTHDGDAYAVGLLERGQLRTEYLKEDGSSVATIWRVEEETMSSNGSNAAMDSQNNMGTDASMSSDATGTTTEARKEDETKTKWKEDGIKTKIKAGDGKLKIKQKKVDD